jgi:hypothetical protein
VTAGYITWSWNGEAVEGSDTVVEAGAGITPRFLKGRRVACAAADPKVTGGGGRERN